MDEENTIITIDDITDEMLFEADTFVWLFDIENEIEREDAIFKLMTRAAGLKRKKEFQSKVAAAKREWRKAKKENQAETVAQTHVQEFSSCPYPVLNTGSWIADDTGILGLGREGALVQAAYMPITIVDICINRETGAEKARIAFRKNGVWKEITPGKSVIASSNKIVSLADTGLGVTSENAKHLVRYLSDLEGVNQGRIATTHSTSKLGWHRSGDELIFLPYDSGIQFDAEERFNRLYDAIKPCGTFEGWQSIIRDIRKTGRIEPRIMIAGSLASVLVEIVSGLPFVLHLFGETEGGKTVCLMLAASVWANPRKNSGFMGDWQTTLVAVEARANVLNHLPMLMDDTAKAEKRLKDDFAEFIYILANGTGKDRSNEMIGLRSPNSWSNCSLTTGEHPLVKENEQGGAINRVLEVKTGTSAIFEDGHGVVEALKANYGHAGRAFVEAVKALGEQEVCDLYTSAYKELLKYESTSKQAMAAALIVVADMIATAYDIYGCKDTVYNDALSPCDMSKIIKSYDDVSENERCLEYLYDQINIHAANFSQFPVERWGRIPEDGSEAYIISTAFKELCRKGGYSWKTFLDWADLNGHIEYCNAKRKMSQLRIDSSPTWCVILKLPGYVIDTDVSEGEQLSVKPEIYA